MSFRWTLILWLPLLAAAADSNRYIVELTGDPVAEHVARESKRTGKRLSMSSEAAGTRRAQIVKEQQQARASLKDLGAEVLDSTDTVSNTLIVRMPDDLVSKVEALPGVKRVTKARTFKRDLDHALPQHKVPQAWNLIGVDKAGLGMKIGVIDSGIDVDNPGMQDSSLTMPAGFPKTNFDTDVEFTNSKVIVARSYVNLLATAEDDISARDLEGHGTASAMAAGGARSVGPLGPITGVAPKAYLGSYKVFGAEGTTSSDVVLRALDQAVTDGMDVITMSLSSPLAQRLGNDLEVDTVERIAGLGILVVSSAGNRGAFNSIGSPGTSPSMITVGASYSDRIFFDGSATVTGSAPVGSYTGFFTGDDPYPLKPLKGSLFDVSTLDQDGTACLPLPLNSLTGKIALIIRLPCTFEEKLNNLQRAGAIGAILYTTLDREYTRDNPPSFVIGAATLPMMMIHNADGLAIKKKLAAQPGLEATLVFNLSSLPADPDGVAGFSSKGPNVDGSIKPDLVAVGTDVYTATSASLGDPPAYTIEFGTSISTPMVAGAAAALKAARPGLTAAQYRSLLINTASPITGRVQATGAGSLNLEAALKSTAAIAPSALHFKTGSADPNLSQSLTLWNLGTATESYSLTVTPRGGGPAPTLGVSAVTLDAGKSGIVPVSFAATGLKAGAYEGFLTIHGTNSGVDLRAPYWYGVQSDTPASAVYLSSVDSGRVGTRINDAILFRVTDGSGIPLSNAQPVATVVSGGGAILDTASLNRQYPGVFSVSVRLGTRRGDNVFSVSVGDVTPLQVTITGN